MHRRTYYIPFVVIVGMMASGGASHSAELAFYADGAYIRYPVESYKERQFRSVIKQEYDFSCGSAALATLLNYHYDRPVAEHEIVNAMYVVGDQEKILREGFSLLDMKRYLESIGYRANGYRASLNKLKSVGVPAIVLINQDGYMHFVVVKGVTRRLVLVGDPSLGMRVVDRRAFERMWNGIIFVILNDREISSATFNRKKDWHLRESAGFSFDAALNDQALANFTIYTTPTPNYYF